ncbi:MAG: hypothetical protein K8F91_18600 [Candidatus Obscuribacterales bacterium]|nr:hypothetical protein [Candidatus Obscuribacterales bacterium]
MNRKKFSKADYPALLGVTEICRADDRDIWRLLVSPIAKGLLGPIVERIDPTVMETVAGRFPGDEVSNLNDHRLHGGQVGFVRFPYVHNFYRTENGAFIVKRDLVKVEVLCWFGDVLKGKGELILKAALRDRRFDGTSRANDTALLDYRYDDPVLHKRISDKLKSVEISIYAYMPGSRIADIVGDSEFEEFVKYPFRFLDKPEQFLKHFETVWKSKRAPGQFAFPIPDVANGVLAGFCAIARKCGYDIIEAAPSHYHVCRWLQAYGYGFRYAYDGSTFQALTSGLEAVRKAGHPLTRAQQSWVCVVQSLKPVELVPEHLRLGGPVWPQDNISDRCLWLYRPISDLARREFQVVNSTFAASCTDA